MGLREFLFGGPVQSSEKDLAAAEEYLSSKCSNEHITALVRHYAVGEVTDDIERFAGVSLNDGETTEIVQKLRNQYGMGPISEGNMPGYVDPDDYPEDQADQRTYNEQREYEQSSGGFIGWLFGR